MPSNSSPRRAYVAPTPTNEIPQLSDQCRQQLNQACQIGSLIRQANAEGRKFNVGLVNQQAQALVSVVQNFSARLNQIDQSVKHLIGRSVGVSNIGSVLQAGEQYQRWMEDWAEQGLQPVTLIINELHNSQGAVNV